MSWLPPLSPICGHLDWRGSIGCQIDAQRFMGHTMMKAEKSIEEVEDC